MSGPHHSPTAAGDTLHVVVPAHNGGEYLPALVESLQSQSRRPDRVHIIDNGSTAEGRADRLGLPTDLQLTTVEQPLGFGGACNVGLRAALAEGADWVMILNQDLVLEPDACERAVELLRSHSDCGMIGLFQLSYDGTSLDPPFRHILPPEITDDAILKSGELNDLYPCEFVPAAAVALSAEALGEVGGFDPLYFMYQEDKDFCRRLRRAGYGIGISTQARARHDCGQTRAVKDGKWRANWFYSRAVYHLKWSPRPLWVSFLTLSKYLRPQWRANEAWWWAVGSVRCLSHVRELQRRRQSSDGLRLIDNPTPRPAAAPEDPQPLSHRSA